jgi:hypothetical protein
MPKCSPYQTSVVTSNGSTPKGNHHLKNRLNFGLFQSLVCTKIWSMPTSSPHQTLVHTRFQSTPGSSPHQMLVYTKIPSRDCTLTPVRFRIIFLIGVHLHSETKYSSRLPSIFSLKLTDRLAWSISLKNHVGKFR